MKKVFFYVIYKYIYIDYFFIYTYFTKENYTFEFNHHFLKLKLIFMVSN